MKKLTALFILMAILVVACSSGVDTENTTPATEATTTTDTTSPDVGLDVGNIAPDVDLVAMDGTRYKLSDFRGQVILLNFWATWCGYCKEEMPMMQELYEKYKDQNFTVIAVDVRETEEQVYEYLDEMESEEGVRLTFPIYMDKKGDLFGKFNKSNGFPQTYIIDQNGVIREYISGTFARLGRAVLLKNLIAELIGVKND